MKQKFIAMLGIIAVLISSFSIVNAAEQRETSSLYMNGGETVTGQARDYNYKYHKIEFYPVRLGYLEGEIGMYNKLYIRLEKKGLLFYSNKGETTIIGISTLNQKYGHNFGNQGSGKFRYIFNTGSKSDWYGKIEANPVYMYSYE